MATVKPRRTRTGKSNKSAKDGVATAEGGDLADAFKTMAQLQTRVGQLEAKVLFDGFDCFHVVANAASMANGKDMRQCVKIDHPLANGRPDALLFAQPLLFSLPVEGFGYNAADGHWYMQLSLYKAIGADWGEFKVWENALQQEFYMWAPGGTPEDWQKTGGNARLLIAQAPIADGYFVAVYVPTAPIPAWAKAATKLKTREDISAAASAAKGTRYGKPKTVPAGVLDRLRPKPK